jgi:acyl-coenzyme A synthetase/AMP-(fatty) acid ligase/3-hydroxymyristoyl/3-hydroxydecanoyl-(acyl carrier protein) dehydratase
MSNQFTHLSQVLSDSTDSAAIVAFDREKSYTRHELQENCRAVVNKLSKSKSLEYVLCCQDSYLFAVAFLSLLHAGKKICMPPNASPGTIREMTKQRELLTDDFFLNLQPGSDIPEMKSAKDCKISLFTSGTTGDCKEVQKDLSNLEAEIAVLEASWSIKESPLATVSHQHIYGLLFKILWPLCSRRPFYIGTALFEDDLNKLFTAYPDSCLISSPAHLDALANYKDPSFLKDKQIFSSGAPLSSKTANKLTELCGRSPIEVFGSTETGGIAWRQQTQSDLWQILDKTSIKAVDKTLLVKSPFTEAGNDWYETGDSVEIIDETSFKHLGRLDKIVKVSGKRVSLNELEQRISSSQLIDSAKIIILTEKTYTGRQSCAAACILSEAGLKKLESNNKRALTQLLKAELKEFFEPVLIPRFWRFVSSFPHNSQGKCNDLLLETLFSGYDEKEIRFPLIRSLKCTSEHIHTSLFIQSDLAFFNGHFEGCPILPGVAQVFIAQWIVEEIFNLSNVVSVKKLKFNKIIRPDKLLNLEINKVKNQITFTFSADSKIHSSGTITYEQ